MFDWLLTIIVATVIVFVLFVLIAIAAGQKSPEQLDDEERKRAQRRAITDQRDSWMTEVRSAFQFCTTGRIVGHPYVERCVFGFDETAKVVRLFGYTMSDEFKVQLEANIPVAKIISVEVVRPMEMKRVKRTQAVGAISSNKKSPVARGLVGGAVLGPAGLVLGAASGASKDIKTEIKEHTVWDQVQMEGDPQLHIGTSDPASPLVRIKPDHAGQAEEWLYRIRAIQSQSANPAALPASDIA